MSRGIALALAASLMVLSAGTARAEDDPFAKGADALAVKDSDGSSSVRAKLKLTKMTKDMIMIRVTKIDDRKFPFCALYGKVLKASNPKARGKTYRFFPIYKLKGRMPNLKDKMTQNNLGACYYPKNTTLVIKPKGFDKKQKGIRAAEIYLK